MAINPAIAMGVRGVELQDPLVQYGKIAAIQGAQQQNQLAQMQMRAAERETESNNALNRAYAEAYNPQTGEIDINRLRGSLTTGGFGSKLPAVEKSMTELKTARTTQQKAEADVAAARMKEARNLLPSVNSPEAYANWRTYTLQSLPGLANMIPTQYSPETVQGLMLEADKALEQHFVNQDLGGSTRVVAVPKYGVGAARTVEGTQSGKTMAPGEAQRIANENARLGLEARRVAVLEENQRRDADPAFQQRMGAARATGEAIAKGDVAAIQALPKIINRAEEGVRLIDEMIGKRDSKTGQLLKGYKAHPGFETSVGATLAPGARYIPGTDAADFAARFDQIKGTSFLEAFESLKGGGAITEKEGQKGTEAINRMSLAQSENEFTRAALDLQNVIRKGVQNAQTRASRSGGAPAAGGVIDFGSLK